MFPSRHNLVADHGFRCCEAPMAAKRYVGGVNPVSAFPCNHDVTTLDAASAPDAAVPMGVAVRGPGVLMLLGLLLPRMVL